MHIPEDYEFAIRSLQVRFRLLLFFIGVPFQSTRCTKVIIITVNRTRSYAVGYFGDIAPLENSSIITNRMDFQ